MTIFGWKNEDKNQKQSFMVPMIFLYCQYTNKKIYGMLHPMNNLCILFLYYLFMSLLIHPNWPNWQITLKKSKMKKKEKIKEEKIVTHIICHVSHVRWQVSHVTSKSKTVRARELKFGEKVNLSCVICHMWQVILFYLHSGLAFWWRISYQQGLPSLV